MKLSLVMNVYNEADMLGDAIRSAEGVDEIVVADMESTDDTVAIAESFGARIITLPHSGYCETGRQAVIDAATGDWCIMLDGDERLSAGAIAHIRELMKNASADVSAYLLPFHTFIGTQQVKGSGWEPERYELHDRLFRRQQITWPPVIHTSPQFTGRVEFLPPTCANELWVDHYNFRDFTHLLDKFNRYTSTEANQIVNGSDQLSLVKGLHDGLSEVIRRYSPDTDGEMSLALCFAMLHYKTASQFKAVEASGWKSPDGAPSKQAIEQAVGMFWNVLAGSWLQEQRARVHERLAETQNVEEAVRELRRMIGVWGSEASLHLDLGTMEFSLGHLEASIEHLQKALELNPELQDAKNNLLAVQQAAAASRIKPVRPAG